MENLAQKKDRSPPEKLRILKANFRKTKNQYEKESKAMKFSRDMIIEELTKRGYVAQATDVEKNGLVLLGISIKKNEEDTVAPTLYVERLNEMAKQAGWELDDVVSHIEGILGEEFPFDVTKLSDKEYFVTHARIGVQRVTDEQIVKRPSGYEGIEKYIYVADSHDGANISFKVKEAMLSEWGIDENFAFKVAEENSMKETEIVSMFDFLTDRYGEAPMYMEDESLVPPMYIISNKNKFRGASAMLDKKAIEELADKIGVHEFILLPSSLHECILVPKAGDAEIDFFNNMVCEVNAQTVDPEDRLVDRAYLLTA